MSKKNIKKSNNVLPKTIKQSPVIAVKPKEEKNKNLIYILISIVVTAIVYAISLDNGWIKNWDDGGYVLDYTNSLGDLVHKLSWHNIKEIFSVFYKGNYHPLTTLFYAIEFSIVKESPFLYHLVNLVFHLLNVFLVYIFVKLLTKKPEIAFITALFFGIHPMHVESVAWISELKDVLYSFLFLGSLICYFYYFTKKENKTRFYIISLSAFFLSSLSKSASVTLPVVMLLIDYYMKRKWDKKLIIEKIPFILIAMIFGVVAIFSQHSAGAIQDINPLYKWFERPLLASYSTMTYILKLFVPIDLTAMYPYPDRLHGFLPIEYYIAPVVVITVAVLVYISRKFNRDIIFGVAFFVVTISLVLQILPVGGAIVSERYSYIPYIGLFMIIGKGYVFSQEDKSKFAVSIKWIYPAILIIGTLMFSVLTFQRIKIWKNGEILFTNVIKKYPNLPFAYSNRGYLYYNFIKDYDKAMSDYNKCLAIDSTFHRAWSNRGVLYFNIGKPDSAIRDFTKALKYDKTNTDALIGRANSYSKINKFDLALPDYNRYIELDQKDAKSYLWRGIAYYNIKKFNEAFADINRCISMLPNEDNAYFWKGLIYYERKDYETAIKEFDHSIELNPKQTEAYSWRGLAEFNLKNYNKAIDDYSNVISKCYKDPTKVAVINDNGDPMRIDILFSDITTAKNTFINRSQAYYEIKKYLEAFKDYCAAGDLGYALNKEHFFKLKASAGK